MASLPRSYEMAPRAARLTNSMRDIGYDFPTAVADLVDNSIAAGASTVEINTHFDGEASYVLIADDGRGMTGNGLNEALRFGSQSRYELGDLGRFGLGLKTASLSQCRRVSVVSRSKAETGRLSVRSLDLDTIEEWDEWLILSNDRSLGVEAAKRRLGAERGTVVVWELMDRVLPGSMTTSGWGRRRLAQLAQRTAAHLSMVFHRFLSGEVGRAIQIRVNGEALLGWDPFARSETTTMSLDPMSFEVETQSGVATVHLDRYVLPPRSRFSSPEKFESLSGPLKWNRQQGLYVYRADRLVQSGGWGGLRAIDEHTKLARAALDFNTNLDHLFQVNVAKMRINLPPAIRQMLEPPIHELCISANDIYRRHGGKRGGSIPKTIESIDLTDVGLAIRSAALEAGHLSAIADVEAILKMRSPEVSRALGFTR